tara:strand:- start:1151 stop:1546 length:396 start_codon:yes stop_codon:yes gene_type:complete
MAKKLSRSKIVKKLDTIFSRYIRLKNADHSGYCSCVTCGRDYHFKSIQAGHFMSRKHYSTRWDENNVYPQCFGCNVMQQGKQFEFSIFLGKRTSNKLLQLSKQTVKFTDLDLQEKISYYNKLVNDLDLNYI